MNTPLSPLKQAFLAIEELQAKLSAAEQAKNAPIAVIGIGCRLPGGANDPDMFWNNLKNGVDAIRDVPPDRWDVEAFYDPDPNVPGKSYIRQAGYLDRIDGFDPQFFAISPREANGMDPQQRLLLEVAWEALEHAAIAPDSLNKSRTGVFLGIASFDYASLYLKMNDPAALDTYYSSGVAHSIASGRLAYVLGLNGPGISVDTACSSSLVATHLAVQSLRNGETDLALACGVNLILSPDNQVTFSRLHMLSTNGRCKTFDAEADGFGDGEGCGVVVLKRLTDALQDNDRILAVIRGSALNQDGASSGLTAPNGPSQEAVVRAALANAGIRPDEVGYVEAHGTGTSLGDPIEVQALGAVLRQDRPADRPFYLGSVKTNVGHLEAAAGVTSLIKAVLMVQHGEIPPHLNFKTPNPLIAWDEIPAVITTALTPWPSGYDRRIVGVSAFGFSGTNAHMLIEAPPQPAPSNPVGKASTRPLHLLALSARNEDALFELAERYEQFLSQPSNGSNLPDVAYSANTGRARLPARLAVLAENAEQAAAKLASFRLMQDTTGILQGSAYSGDPPKIAFLFTGQGAQYVEMGRQLYEAGSPVFRAALDRCDEVLRPYLGESLLDILYPDTPAAAQEKINHTAFTQPALFAIEYALAQQWLAWGIIPSAVMGHSVGEYVAAVLAGVFSLEDGLMLIAARGRLMGALPEGGTMAAIFAPVEQVQPAITHPLVSIAAVNGPDNTVISGERAAVQEVLKTFESQGIKARELKVSHAFHSPLMDPMLDEFESIAARVQYSNPKIRLVSDVTGEFATPGQVTSPRYWREHVRLPVQFMHSIETLYRERYDVFVEVGPSPTLTNLGQRILVDPDRQVTWVSSLKQNQDDWGQILTGLGTLFVRGVSVDWQAFDHHSPRQKLALPTYPFQRSRYWLSFKPQAAAQARSEAGVHPLLGSKLRSPAKAVTFERWLSTRAFSFLNDHRVFGAAILPATGFIELGFAAARETFGDGLHSVEDLFIHNALRVEDDQEVLMQVVVSPLESGTGTPGSARMEVYSQVTDADPWVLHASGTLTKQAGAVPPQAQELPAIQGRCVEILSGEEHYQHLFEKGLPFGDSLKGVAQLWRRDGEGLGKIYSNEVVQAENGYVVHPAYLDAHLQVMAAALTQGPEVYLPMHVEKIQRYKDTAPTWSHVEFALNGGTTSRETVHGDLSLLDDAGEVVVQISGITLKMAQPDVFRKPAPDKYEDWLYTTSWQPVPPTSSTTPVSTGHKTVVSPVRLAEQLEPAMRRLYEQNGLDEYMLDLLPEFDRLARIYITNAFLKLGWQPKAGQHFTAAGLAEQLNILPQHRRLLGYLLRILSEDGIVRPADDGGWEVCLVPQVEDARTLQAALMKLFPQYEGELEITGRCGAQFAEAIRGTADPLQLLFPGGSLETVEKIYQKSPSAKAYNGLVRSAVEAIRAASPGSHLRVLEIGAGTGGTSSFVLPVLAGSDAEYLFSDISPLFTEKARQKFSQFPFVRYQPLDIEKDPDTQGLAGQQFDLVIAANVIHATQDLRTTLRHIRQHMAPGALFIMLEVTAPQRWVDLTFGLTDGWWRFIDKDLRPDYPLLSRSAWVDLLRLEGFAEAATVPQVQSQVDENTLEEAVIIALAPTGSVPAQAADQRWLVLGDRNGIGTALTQQLQEAGESCLLSQPAPEALPDLIAQAGPLKGVVHLGDTRLALGLVQSLVSMEGIPPRVWLVTSGAQPAGDLTGIDPYQAELWGFGKVLALEHPDLSCIRVDLDPSDPQPASTLYAEISLPDGEGQREDEVAWRGKDRLAARLAKLPQPLLPLPAGAKQLTITQPGDIDSLAWQPIELPQPGPGQVGIRVQASGLNFKDLMITLGMVPGEPSAPIGGECAGVVTSLGEDTPEHPLNGLKVGDPVIAVTPGSFATHLAADAAFVTRQPANLSLEQSASVMIPFITADYALNHLGQMKAGEKVLVHAGAGGVGLAAIQLAQRVGAEVFATAGSPEKRLYLQSLGVPHVMDSRSLSFAGEIMQVTHGEGVDLVLNSLSGEFTAKSLDVLAENGRFLELSKSSLLTPEQAAALGRNIRYFIIDWTDQVRQEPQLIRSIMQKTAADLAAGALQPLPVLTFPSSETIAAFRYMQQARHTGKIVVTDTVPQPEDKSLPFVRSDASYLVTGGLRGLGLLTAQWLVDQGARYLALMGRSAPTPETLESLKALESAGVTVLVIQGDVSVEADVRKALDQVRQALPPLRGIIHAAGRLDDAVLTNQTWQRFETVYGPKVSGAMLLHRLTQGQPLDFFVLYSSIASLFGSPGQANHAAANAFMDALAHMRRSLGLPALSINWGVWEEVGAAADRGVVGRSTRQGIESFSPKDGLEVLDRLMHSSVTQAGVCPMDWALFLGGYGKDIPPFLRSIAADEARASARTAAPGGSLQERKSAQPEVLKPEVLRQLADAPAERKRSVLLSFVQSQAAKVLGLQVREVSEHTPFNEMGLDSLMAVELRNLLGTGLALKRQLPVSLVYDYPTVTAICDYLAKDILSLETAASDAPAEAKKAAAGEQGMLDSIEDLSDEDVDRLLAEINKGKK